MEIPLKLQVCKTLNYILDVRENFLLSNAIEHYLTNGKKIETKKKDLSPLEINSYFEKKMVNIFSRIMKTGVESIDENHSKMDKDEHRHLSKLDPQEFFIYDFDYLEQNEPTKNTKKILGNKAYVYSLPSFLYTFAVTSDL